MIKKLALVAATLAFAAAPAFAKGLTINNFGGVTNSVTTVSSAKYFGGAVSKVSSGVNYNDVSGVKGTTTITNMGGVKNTVTTESTGGMAVSVVSSSVNTNYVSE